MNTRGWWGKGDCGNEHWCATSWPSRKPWLRAVLALGLVLYATASRTSQKDDLNGEELALDLEEKPLEGEALETLIAALDATNESLSQDLKTVLEPFKAEQPETGMLRKLIGELSKTRREKQTTWLP